MDIYETNEKFTELRKSLGLSRVDVGYMLGIPYRTLQDWELKRRRMTDYMYDLIRIRLCELPKYEKMVEVIRERFGLSSLKFNTLETLVEAIGLPKCKLCTHCFDGSSHF